MACSKTPVFIETNLGTRLAVPISPDITVKEFKRELEWMHLNCFPEFGSIRVNALMVKLKSCFYHLSESLPLKYVFLGSNGTWFLQMDVVPQSIPDQIEPFEFDRRRMKCEIMKISKIRRFPNLEAVLCLSKRKKGMKNVKKKYKSECEKKEPRIKNETPGRFSTRAESLSETFSESVSVSGIIKKYFADYEEVASSSGFPFTTVRNRHKGRLNRNFNTVSPVKDQIPPQEKKHKKKPEVGKRLLLASDSLGLIPNNKWPPLSLCKSGEGKKSLFQKSAGVVRNLVFEMTDESE